MWFVKEMNKKFRGDPSMDIGKIGKRSGELWRQMSEEEKKPYNELADQDKARYKKEMD